MRLAILADIHGNLPALEAVITELERLQPDYVVLDGDLINGVPFSPQVIDRVRAQNWAVVRGNHEFYLLDFGTERAVPGHEDATRWGQLHWLIEKMTPAQVTYLATLPDERTLYLPGTQPIRVAHGVPGRNRVGFYTDQPSEAIIAEIDDVPEQTLISAHTHVQIDRHLRIDLEPESDPFVDPHRSALLDGSDAIHRQWHLINPGSVGLPLNGRSHAQFALLESVDERVSPGGWQATHFQTAYDRRPALEAFDTSGMAEAGGAISRLFYWELVTAQPEILRFYAWSRKNGIDPDDDIDDALRAYIEGSGRESFVRAADPLYGAQRV